jgi:hypothetical protein
MVRKALVVAAATAVVAVRAVANLVYSQAVIQKVAQGSAELAQGLYSQSNAFVPYGQGQMPLGAYGRAVQNVGVQPVQQSQRVAP